MRASAALTSFMVLNIIRVTMCSLTYVGYDTYITYSIFQWFHTIIQCLAGYIRFSKWFGRCSNWLSPFAPFSCLVDLRYICLLSYMSYIYCVVLRPVSFYVVHIFLGSTVSNWYWIVRFTDLVGTFQGFPISQLYSGTEKYTLTEDMPCT